MLLGRSAARLVASVSLGIAAHPVLAVRCLSLLVPLGRKSARRFGLQVRGREFVADFLAASAEANVHPFLMWGTLLGFVRDGGFIWRDYDIDFGIMAVDYAKKASLVQAMQRRGYKLTLDIPYKLRFRRSDGVYLDVDVFYRWQDRVVQTGQFEAGGAMIGTAFPADAFDRFRVLTTIGGLDVLVPDPPERVLETVYGNWRQPVSAYNSRQPSNGISIEPDAVPPELVTET